MRLLSSRRVLFAVLLISSSTAGFAQGHPNPPGPAAPGLRACDANAQAGYPDKKCLIKLDRDNVMTSKPYTVPGGTTVTIEIDNARWNETVTFAAATTQTVDPDPLYTFFKNAMGPLGSVVFKQDTHGQMKTDFVAVPGIGPQLKHAEDILTAVQRRVQDATTSLTCLETYKAVASPDPQNPNALKQCSVDSLTAKTFLTAKDAAVADIATDDTGAGKLTLPIATLKSTDTAIAAAIADCANKPNPSDCLDIYNALASIQLRLVNLQTDLQTAQKALLAAALVLQSYPGTARTLTYSIVQSRSHTSVVTVTASEVITKTPATIGTVTISWLASPWAFSTGIGFSNLAYKTYANSPLLDAKGNPMLDSGGKTLTVVTENDQTPSIDTPLVLGNYRIPFMSRWRWESSCPNHCSFLISGGVGANLTSKSADFMAGPSFQIGPILFTGGPLFGRETRLTNGVHVGSQLGSSAPTLPTHNFWTIHTGFSITYIIQ